MKWGNQIFSKVFYAGTLDFFPILHYDIGVWSTMFLGNEKGKIEVRLCCISSSAGSIPLNTKT